ncbi:MAG TPA: TonB C-terminal domain-containing protein [Gallionella sp.]|nr:TonB C-terminal domain-containing protein [Gallionella sp.]
MPFLIGSVFILAVVAGIVVLIKNFLDHAGPPNIQRVQQISLIQPPEPPPPPPPEEKPPEVKQEVKLDEPPPQPDAPPPGANLGLDAEGRGNGDAFGLIGNKGGRELTLGGFGSRFGGYLGGMQKSIHDELAHNDKLRKGEYKIDVAIWIRPNGSVDRFELLASSGMQDVDAALKKVLASIKQFDEPPPDMPQPVKLRISSR